MWPKRFYVHSIQTACNTCLKPICLNMRTESSFSGQRHQREARHSNHPITVILILPWQGMRKLFKGPNLKERTWLKWNKITKKIKLNYFCTFWNSIFYFFVLFCFCVIFLFLLWAVLTVSILWRPLWYCDNGDFSRIINWPHIVQPWSRFRFMTLLFKL